MAGFVLVALMVGLAMAVAVHNSRQLRETRGWVAHTYEVEGDLEETLRLVTDAETGLRGFVITGQEPFLAQYREAEAHIGAQLRRIKELTADNLKQQRQFPELERLVAEKLEFSSQVITVAKEQGLEAGRQLVATGKGRETMDAIRKVIAGMRAEEERLLRIVGDPSEEAEVLAALCLPQKEGV